jgi:uncharacterized protein with FMN-binding domain
MIIFAGIKKITLLFLFLSLFLLPACASLYKDVRDMHIKRVDLANIKDGTYMGAYKFGLGKGFTYTVLTRVKNGKIENITMLKNQNSRYAKMAEGVLKRIIRRQSPDVDTISGATTTSKAIMKAVENSLVIQTR